MTTQPLSSLDRYSELVLSNGYVPWWEVHPERVQPTPPASPAALAAAFCPTSPTRAHVWWVADNTETCRWCGAVRPVKSLQWEVYPFSNPPPGRPASAFNVSMRSRLLSIAVGESMVIDHHHLQCLAYESGGLKRCGLNRAVSRLRGTVSHRRDWEVTHLAPYIGVVRRTL